MMNIFSHVSLLAIVNANYHMILLAATYNMFSRLKLNGFRLSFGLLSSPPANDSLINIETGCAALAGIISTRPGI
jgi:hypothetical protein